ncbi:MAG: M28 family peptidase, partial [Thermoanaerobaculia bacterium]|nr:M28 family peptidase [Thermoanaerobaculia bacterium]
MGGPDRRRGRWLPLLALLGAGCGQDRPPPHVMAAYVPAARLEGHVRALAEQIGERNVFRPSALAAAADYLEGQWRDQGYGVRRQSYTARGVESSNLEVTRRGEVAADEIVLVCAHYDSVEGSPGANDNASGVAALLELSRLFAALPPPPRTLRFVAFVNEEPPFYYWESMGSMVYARAARERGDDIRLMVSLETIGYYTDEPGSQRYPPLIGRFFPDRGSYLGFVSNFRSRGWLRRAVRGFEASSSFPTESAALPGFIPGVSWSDHLSFWRHDY